MATVIDSLVLELGLDPKNFTAGQRQVLQDVRNLEEASRRAGLQVEAQSKRSSDLLLSFRREALTALGLFVGGRGAREVIDYVTNLDASTGRLSHTLDVNVGAAEFPGMTRFATWLMRKKIREVGAPPVREYLEMMQDGGAKLYACKMTCDMMGLGRADFIEGVIEGTTAADFIDMSEGAQIIFI